MKKISIAFLVSSFFFCVATTGCSSDSKEIPQVEKNKNVMGDGENPRPKKNNSNNMSSN